MKRKRYNPDINIKKHLWNVNLINLSLSLAYDTLCFRVKQNSELKQRERWPSLDGTLLSHTTNLNSSSYLPLCEFVESEHRKTENIHFQFPFLMSWTSTFWLLIKVPIVLGWGRWSAGWDGDGGRGEGRVNTLFKLWTIYLWLTSQFTIVQYIYAANLRCMAAQ